MFEVNPHQGTRALPLSQCSMNGGFGAVPYCIVLFWSGVIEDAHPTSRSTPDGRRRGSCAGTTGTSRRPFPWPVLRRAARLPYFTCDPNGA
jgi:hypothetical protein